MAYISGARGPIRTKLGQWYRGHLPFMSPDRSRVRGSRGHGVKNTIFTKNFSTQRRFGGRSSNFQIRIVSRPSTIVTYREFCRMSCGVAEVKLRGQIFNFVRFQRLTRQIVRLEPTIQCVNGDLFVRPFLKLGVKGQRKVKFLTLSDFKG